MRAIKRGRCRNFVSPWQRNDLVFVQIAGRYVAKRHKTPEKRRFDTHFEGFHHRRCSLGILRESLLYGKTLCMPIVSWIDLDHELRCSILKNRALLT